MKAGGDNVLKMDPKRLTRERLDWKLFSFVPGYINEDADNPLTWANHEQYMFRMHKTNPPPQVFKPKPYTGPTPVTGLTDVYGDGRRQPMFNQSDRRQYIGDQLEFSQRTRHRSHLLNVVTNGVEYPDEQQLMGRWSRTMPTKQALLLASKNIM